MSEKFKQKPKQKTIFIFTFVVVVVFCPFHTHEFSHTLLYGNHLDDLIDARKKWLAPDGLMFPDRCNLYITAINDQMLLDRSNFWQHVYTFDMRPMIPAVISEPYFQRVHWSQVQKFELIRFESQNK